MTEEPHEHIKTLFDVYDEDDAILSLLYPPIPDDYFNEYEEEQIWRRDADIFEKYNQLDIKPFIKQIDLNEYVENDDIRPVKSWVGGVEIKF